MAVQPIAQDRLVEKSVSLGQVREIPPPTAHIGLSIAPFKEVQSDDVIFGYIAPEVTGLAPARAEDSESELASKDDFSGQGRASLIDWAIKDHYDASDVSRYRELLRMQQLVNAGGSFPLTIGNMTEDFAGKVARDTSLRKKKLDNRIEWLIMKALEAGEIVYDDGKIKFTVDYGRPANQTLETATNGLWSGAAATIDPIDDFNVVDEFMYTTHSVRLGKAIGSRKAWNALARSDRWAARSGIAGATGGKPVDPNYLIAGWGPKAAREIYSAQTGLTCIEYDSVYRTRTLGSNAAPTNNRFMRDDIILFLPAQEYIDEVSDGEVGFGATLTSPHPEGGWTSGYYEWEQETKDPWGQDKGTGIKAFPVFPFLEYTYTMKVL